MSTTLREAKDTDAGASPERPEDENTVTTEAFENARREAFMLVATARKEAERIISEAHDEAKHITDQASSGIGKLASLGDSADELFAHIKSLIKRQKEFDAERRTLMEQIAELELERDILMHRIAAGGAGTPEVPEAAADPSPQAEQAEADSPQPRSVASRVDEMLAFYGASTAVVEEPAAADVPSVEEPVVEEPEIPARPSYRDESESSTKTETRSFYSRRSAKLPHLGDEAGRNALTSLAAMRRPHDDDDDEDDEDDDE